MGKVVILLCSLVLLSFTGNSFKQEQLKYAHVQTAYREKWAGVKASIYKAGIDTNHFEVCLMIFKQEGQLQVWARTRGTVKYNLINTYSICRSSGDLGPKRKEGDDQVPEGFYQVSAFQPMSEFYLALQVNYPNRSDRIKSNKLHPGGDIMIHGNCVTIGCMPMTDDIIKEIYIMAVEARNDGQFNIPICIFPTELTGKNMKWLKDNVQDKEKIAFWENLEQGYTYFQTNKTLPKIGVDAGGNYTYE